MDKAREILRQHFEVGLSQREIADSVKVSLGTVSGILAKARAAGIGYAVKLSNVHSFEYFGGVPRIIVPYNTKTAVSKIDLHDPEANRTYADMARHYGAAIVPARVRKPKDKAPVETGVQIAERRIIAKLRDRQLHGFDEVWEAVRDELEEVNRKPFQKLPGSKLSVFRETEQPQLRPLPPTRYECADWKQVRAGMDCHVRYDGHFYSVPYLYAGKRLELRATAGAMEVFCDHERIASHIRSYASQVRYVTLPEHMPSNHRAVADWTPERLEAWARKFGPDTHDYIRFLILRREHPEQAFKTCAGILRMGESLSATGMEAVCRAAKEKNVFTYKYFSMLFKRMASERDKRPSAPIRHENLRGGSYYGGDANA